MIPTSFFLREDVVQIAQELIGKHLFTFIDGRLTGGRIIETEAYAGETDRACHAYGGRRTLRTDIMYQEGGIAYIYLCYGMHHLLNIVTHRKGIPHAVLIRAIVPDVGLETICKRRGKTSTDKRLITGPGTVCQALGLTLQHNAVSLTSNTLWLEDRGPPIHPTHITSSTRIGVAYAKEDALLPYRFSFKPL